MTMINLRTISLDNCKTFIESDKLINSLRCSQLLIDIENGLLVSKVYAATDTIIGQQVVATPLDRNGYYYIYNMSKHPILSAAFLIGRATYKQFHALTPMSIGCSVNNHADICVNLLPEDLPSVEFSNPYLDVMSCFRFVDNEDFENHQKQLLSELFSHIDIDYIPFFCNPEIIDREWESYVDEMRHNDRNSVNIQNIPGMSMPGMNGTSDVTWMQLQSRTMSGR